MAKRNARGTYEVASAIGERRLTANQAYAGSPAETYRQKFCLRSDGKILAKIVWVQPDGGERNPHRGTFTIWSDHTIKADHRNQETLVRILAKYGYTLVTADTLTLERKATAQAAADKRQASKGPALSDQRCLALHQAAHVAGMAAGRGSSPVPMVVAEHANPFDDSSPVVASELVNDGECGCAYVTVRPADGSFGKWARSRGWFPAHGGGLMLSVHAFGQSVTRKAAYAAAYAEVLREADVTAYSSTWIN